MRHRSLRTWTRLKSGQANGNEMNLTKEGLKTEKRNQASFTLNH